MRTPRIAFTTLAVFLTAAAHGATTIRFTRVEYEDRVQAVWTARLCSLLQE